jgi:hypothetical protein
MANPQFVLLHAYNGVTIIALSIFQVVIGVFRPHKEPDEMNISRSRRIFEGIHIWNGRAIIVLSVIQIFLGIQANPRYPTYYQYIYAPIPACFVLFIIYHEVRQCFSHSGTPRDETFHLNGEHDY